MSTKAPLPVPVTEQRWCDGGAERAAELLRGVHQARGCTGVLGSDTGVDERGERCVHQG